MLIMDFLIDIGVTEISCSFRFVWGGKTGKEIPASSRLELLEGFLANNFTSSDAEDKTSATLNRGGIADLLLLRTLIYSFVLLMCEFGSFKSRDESCDVSSFRELWRQDKLLKTIDISQAWTDI